MKTNELRIGNWVNYCNGKRILDAELFLQLLKYTTPFDPIPLTEDWFLKFGIERRQIKDLISYNTNQLELYQYASNNNKIFFEHAHGEVELKYVHQLQNLYFALTGEELTYGGELNNIAFSNKTSTDTANVDLNKPLTKPTGL